MQGRLRKCLSEPDASATVGFLVCFLSRMRRRKDRKGKQIIRTCLVLLSVLSVLAVKFLAYGFFIEG